MKILQLAPYVTVDSNNNLTDNKTGFGYMVYDIATGLAKDNKVDMLLLNCSYKEFRLGGIRFIENNILKAFSGLIKIKSLIKLVNMISKYKMSIISMFKLIYQWLLMSYLERIIHDGNYDIIHIHGCSYINTFIIDICKKNNIKFVITLHGLNSFDESVNLELAGKQYEKDFLYEAYIEQWPLTFISTGMKKQVLEFLKTEKADNISIICNSFNINEGEEVLDIKAMYNIPKEVDLMETSYNLENIQRKKLIKSKLLCCIGNICQRKNQKQIIDAFDNLPNNLKHITYILFIGKEDETYNFKDYVNKSIWKEHFVRCGYVNKSNIYNYYKACDGVLMVSFSEGFGLSLIEGMSYGKPCLAIKTMDAFEDIYSSDAVVGVTNHDDKLIGKGIEDLLTRQWDESQIKKHSIKFSSQKMTDSYTEIMKRIIYTL